MPKKITCPNCGFKIQVDSPTKRKVEELQNIITIFETACIGLYFPGKLELYKFTELVDENAKMKKLLFKYNLFKELEQ